MEQKKSIRSKLANKQWFRKWVVMPVLLFLFWMILSYINLYQNLGITILTYNHAAKEIVTKSYSELLKGQKIIGEFRAKDNNLGIVAVRFNTYFRINEDTVLFRIKNKKDKSWYYEYHYTTPQFQPNQYFTFGFPIIPDSEGNIYDFEIESTMGEHENAVALSPIEPIFETKYQYSKDLIVNDIKHPGNFFQSNNTKSYAGDFLIRKTKNSFSNSDFSISFIVYALPLLLYIIWLFFFEKFLADKYYLATLPLFAMIVIALANFTRNDTAVLGFTLLWGTLALVYHLRSNISFVLAICFLIVSIILLYTSQETISKNFTMWGYMLLVVGVAQEIFELKWERKKLLGFTEIKKLYFR